MRGEGEGQREGQGHGQGSERHVKYPTTDLPTYWRIHMTAWVHSYNRYRDRHGKYPTTDCPLSELGVCESYVRELLFTRVLRLL